MTANSDRASTRKTWVVLPAYNEERDLPDLLTRFSQVIEETGIELEILVVDDGSSDRTGQVIHDAKSNLPVRLLQHPKNLGLGSTIRDGLNWACELASPSDIIISLDADNSHTPELMIRMVRLIREGHDVVIASRFRPGSRIRGVPIGRRILSWCAGVLFKVLFPIRGVRDYTCGYRAYRADVLQEAVGEPGFFDQDGFQVMVDILLKLRNNRDLIFGETPLILRYDLKLGESKMDVGQTTWNTLALLIRRRFG